VAPHRFAQWAITARGFNNTLANKMLCDRRPHGLHAALCRRLLGRAGHAVEDIDRIEVIKWTRCHAVGANAVNGVINIITKSAKDTQGGLAAGGAGTALSGFGGLR